jgi:hypothetical protein
MKQTPQIPFNTIPVFIEGDKPADDTGRRVVINSIGGALRNVKGTVSFGPHIYWYNSMTRVKAKNERGYTLRPAQFKTQPSWCVMLDGFMKELTFVASELEFLD